MNFKVDNHNLNNTVDNLSLNKIVDESSNIYRKDNSSVTLYKKIIIVILSIILAIIVICIIVVLTASNPKCTTIKNTGESCGFGSSDVYFHILYETDIGPAYSYCDITECKKIIVYPYCGLGPDCQHACDYAMSLLNTTMYCGYFDGKKYRLMSSLLSLSGVISMVIGGSIIVFLLILLGVYISKMYPKL